MALLDRMKAQAAQVAQKAQEAGRAGQSKLEDAQARRHLDALYRSLGAAMYAQHVGRGDTAAEIERLYGELKQFEQQHDAKTMSEPDGSSSPDPGTSEAGDFKID